jgi:hypothetical protein
MTTGGSVTGNVSFGDNDKILLGNSDDLQLYHDGTHSYIEDTGTGSLFVKAQDFIILENTAGDNYFAGQTGGAATLYYAGAATLATTASGCDITGTVDISDTAGATLKLTSTDTTGANTETLGQIDFVSSDSSGGSAGTQARIKGVYEDNGDSSGIAFLTGASTGSGSPTINEVMRIRHEGNVGIGITTPDSEPRLHVRKGDAGGVDSATNSVLTIENSTTAVLQFLTPNTASQQIRFGDPQDTGAGFIQYNHSVNAIQFGANGPEKMRLDSAGDVLIGKTSSSLNTAGHELASTGYAFHTRSSGNVLYVNRQTNDGGLVNFYQDGTSEGTISVSGTLVSYNGGHLARWSQLTDGTKDTNIVKGTVMTNLDQMAVWHHEAVAATYYVDGDELPEITPATYYTEDDTLPEGVSVGDEKTAAVYAQVGDEKTPAADAYTENNEQLNCMAVSSVEGDSNVAGVFVNWDNDDDEFNDMNIAMTGDVVIRIAQDTTVARGDLLMSAGDGTAKPQGDDIVRSKTIAKVTSTHVSHTYDDGSYLVPCVLMAC